MTTALTTQKTPAAVLADERGEGLNSPLAKKESNTMVSQPMTPAKACRAQREFAKLDLPALSRGTVTDLRRAARKVGVSPADLFRAIEAEEAKR